MRASYVVMLVAGAIAIIVGASWFAYSSLSSSRQFVSTDNAEIVAELVQVGSSNAGRITVIYVDVGASVVEGQVIATVNIPTAISRSAITDTTRIGFRDVQEQRADVLAPRSGVIAARWSNEGDIVPAGQRIITLMDPKEVWVEATIDEDKIRRVRPGQAVEVDVETLGRKLAGRVETVWPVTTASLSASPPGSTSSDLKAVERVVPIRIRLDEDHPSLIPGSSAKIKIRTR